MWKGADFLSSPSNHEQRTLSGTSSREGKAYLSTIRTLTATAREPGRGIRGGVRGHSRA